MRVERDRDPRSNKPSVTREDEEAVKGKQEQSTKREGRKEKEERESRVRNFLLLVWNTCFLVDSTVTSSSCSVPLMPFDASFMDKNKKKHDSSCSPRKEMSDQCFLFYRMYRVYVSCVRLSLSLSRSCHSGLTSGHPGMYFPDSFFPDTSYESIDCLSLYSVYMLIPIKGAWSKERECEWYGFKVSSHIEWKQRKRRSWWGLSHDHAGSWIERRNREEEEGGSKYTMNEEAGDQYLDSDTRVNRTWNEQREYKGERLE